MKCYYCNKNKNNQNNQDIQDVYYVTWYVHPVKKYTIRTLMHTQTCKPTSEILNSEWWYDSMVEHIESCGICMDCVSHKVKNNLHIFRMMIKCTEVIRLKMMLDNYHDGPYTTRCVTW